jgi:hypothetical protein
MVVLFRNINRPSYVFMVNTVIKVGGYEDSTVKTAENCN